LAYYGDRTREALDEMADNLAAQAGPPHHVEGVGKTSKSPGCNFSGFLLVKKVPGTMHFGARAPGHSVDHLNMNMSHFVHHFYYGTLPSPRRRRALAALHPLGLSDDWADKLRGRSFMSPSAGATYEHYAQVRWGGLQTDQEQFRESIFLCSAVYSPPVDGAVTGTLARRFVPRAPTNGGAPSLPAPLC